GGDPALRRGGARSASGPGFDRPDVRVVGADAEPGEGSEEVPAVDQGGCADVGGVGADRGLSGDLPSDLAAGRSGEREFVGGDVYGGGGGRPVERAGEGGASDPGAAHEVR